MAPILPVVPVVLVVLVVLAVLVSRIVFSSRSVVTTDPVQNRANDQRLPYAPVRADAVITHAECDRLIARATGSLTRSMTLGNVVSDVRTSEQAWVDASDASVGDIVTKIRTRAAQMTGIFRSDLFEQLQVARYEASQQYKPHFDACVDPRGRARAVRHEVDRQLLGSVRPDEQVHVILRLLLDPFPFFFRAEKKKRAANKRKKKKIKEKRRKPKKTK